MTDEHSHAAAEELARAEERLGNPFGGREEAELLIARAQVHAILALADKDKPRTHCGTCGDLRLAVARFTAEHWQKAAMATTPWDSACHPLAMVLHALDGETEPENLGITRDQHEALNRIVAQHTPVTIQRIVYHGPGGTWAAWRSGPEWLWGPADGDAAARGGDQHGAMTRAKARAERDGQS